MQLESTPLQTRLANAVGSLLAAVATIDQASAAGRDWEVAGSGFFYSESDRISAYEEMLYAKKTLSDGETISIKHTLDILTGASPTGEAKPSATQTFTTASGSQITNKSGASPLGKFEDIRTAFNIAWDRPIGKAMSSNLTANFSYEYDYTSAGAGIQLSRDIFDKQATLNAGASANYDVVRPAKGVPTGLKSSLTTASYDSDQKFTYDLLLGTTTVVNKNTLATVTFMYGASRGYLTDPYKLISRLNVDGTPSGSAQFEKRPEERKYRSMHLRMIHQLTQKSFQGDVADVAYRWYSDDWDVSSHTIDARYRHDLDGKESRKNKEYIQGHVRAYYQSAANFYYYGLPVLAPDPPFASADYRLAKLGTATAGITWGREVLKDMTLTVRGEYLYQWYMDTHLSPLGAILTQASLYYQF